MINLEELNVLKDKIIYNTSSDKYVLYEKNESIMSSVDFKLLGFLNGYAYSYSDGYLIKSTIEQTEIARISMTVSTGVFIEGLSYMYFYYNNTVYKVSENMIVEWSKSFDDNIRDITMDYSGNIYILFNNSRIIRKFNPDGDYVYYLNESDNPSRNNRLYKTYISKGGGHLYVIGSEFWDGKVRSFVDHYDALKCKKLSSITLCEYDNVKQDDPYYTYKDLHIDGDYLYIYSNNYIEKLNIKLRSIWKYIFGYNYISNDLDHLVGITFDDDKYKNRIYFCENLTSSGGYSFGKLDTNGSLLWKIINPESITKSEFNICIYKSNIFITTKRDVTVKANYVLALDNNRILFETRDNNLIRIVENNYDSIYSPENYVGEYLVGDEIKEGIPKTVIYNLLYDHGDIVEDDGINLIVEEPNPDYTNKENYNYFRLIGNDLTDPADSTKIITLDGKYILSFNNSYIETLYPYQPGLVNQLITDADGNILNTEDDKDIIRTGGIYAYSFYLLADRYKFAQRIATKKYGKSIATKKKGHLIIRKTKYVYRYVVKQLLDIDIIVEYLMENGILDTLIPHYVDKLRHHTTHMIRDMQKALKPQYFNIEPVKRYGYQYNGYDYPLRVSKTQMFMCKNIPYIGKRKDNSIFIESMTTLIENEELTPFLLFLDGQAIKWSDVTIVRDWYFSYIIINNNSNESENLEAVMFPCVIRYGEDNKILPNITTGLYFDKDGLLTDNKNNIAFRLEVIDSDVKGSEHELSSDKKYIKCTDSEYEQLADQNNILVFEDGKLFGESRFYLDYKGNNMFTYDRYADRMVFKTFYFDKANDSKNMLIDVPVRDEVENTIIDGINTQSSQPTDNFMVPFDFYFTRDKSYLQNISEATRYILTYRMQLLVDFYKDQSNIKSFIYTGEKVLSLSSNHKGYLVMPRQKVDWLNDYIMVFKNDELYEYYNEIEYEANMFKIPIFSHVVRTDKIEIIHFKKVNNLYSSLTITEDSSDYISEYLRYNDYELFGNSYSGKPVYDDFNIESCKQYPVKFNYKNSYNKYGKYLNTKIELDDPYYIGKKINIASKRQFHYMYYNVTDQQREFKLSPDFRFAHNKNQFMIFINGVKLNQDEWELVSNANDDSGIFTTIIKTDNFCNNGDRINIFYLPESYEEIIIDNHHSEFGDLILDTSELGYTFDRELFLIFIDGKKVQTERIQNISANRVRILSPQPEYHKVCICKYLNPDKMLEKIYSYGDIWTNAVNSISVSDYEKLFTKVKDVIRLK